jgi:hypothetical protein
MTRASDDTRVVFPGGNCAAAAAAGRTPIMTARRARRAACRKQKIRPGATYLLTQMSCACLRDRPVTPPRHPGAPAPAGAAGALPTLCRHPDGTLPTLCRHPADALPVPCRRPCPRAAALGPGTLIGSRIAAVARPGPARRPAGPRKGGSHGRAAQRVQAGWAAGRAGTGGSGAPGTRGRRDGQAQTTCDWRGGRAIGDHLLLVVWYYRGATGRARRALLIRQRRGAGRAGRGPADGPEARLRGQRETRGGWG